MSEQDVREGLRAAVSAEPPLSFDPDALVTKAKHQAKSRRALAGVGAATVAVAVAAVALPTLLGTPRGSVPAGGQGPAVPQPCAVVPSAEPPSPTIPPSAEPPPSKLRPSPVPTPTARPSANLVQPTPPSVQPPDEVQPTPSPSECPPVAVSPPEQPSPAAPPVPSGVDIAWPPPNVTPVHYTAQQLKQRGAEMREHLGSRFGAVVVGAEAISPGAFQGEAAGHVEDGQGYLNAFTTFTLNGVDYAVDIFVAAPGTEVQSPSQECGSETGAKCEMATRPDGSSTLIKTELVDPANGQLQIVSVIHYRNNGSVVRATGYNYDPTSSSVPTFSPTIPVSTDQLTALATDPALGL